MANNNIAYNKYPQFDEYSYELIKYMIDNNEVIWKLLKYNTPDAWDRPNLTKSEKVALIYKGSGITSDFRVFMDDGAPDVEVDEVCQVRIYPASLFPENRTVTSMGVVMETYSHYKINTLSNYTTRVDRITKELLATFNGTNVHGIGNLTLSKLALSGSRSEIQGQIPFKRKWLLFGTKI